MSARDRFVAAADGYVRSRMQIRRHFTSLEELQQARQAKKQARTTMILRWHEWRKECGE